MVNYGPGENLSAGKNLGDCVDAIARATKTRDHWIVAMHDGGFPISEIAASAQMHRQQVYRILKRPHERNKCDTCGVSRPPGVDQCSLCSPTRRATGNYWRGESMK